MGRGGIRGGDGSGAVIADRGGRSAGGLGIGVEAAEGPEDVGLMADPGLDGRPLHRLDAGQGRDLVARGLRRDAVPVGPVQVVPGHLHVAPGPRGAVALAPAHVRLSSHIGGAGRIEHDVFAYERRIGRVVRTAGVCRSGTCR